MIHVANFQLLPCMQYYDKTDRTVTQADHTLHWRHNDYDGVSNHKPCGCLLNRLFRRRSKKTSKLRVTGLCAGNSPRPVNSPHKGPVTWKMFPFDDVIMTWRFSSLSWQHVWPALFSLLYMYGLANVCTEYMILYMILLHAKVRFRP